MIWNVSSISVFSMCAMTCDVAKYMFSNLHK